MAELLGRTNQAFPSVWLSLSLPREPRTQAALVEAALATGAPIDITSGPALWGGQMRGTEAVLSCVSSAHYENANDETHATDLVQAHLIETLSCVGREYFDFYWLRVRRAAEEYQISGALQAMELARQEGHIRFLGICCDGLALATLGVWQFNDAFDALLVPRNHFDPEPYETLAPLARERRVGIVTSRPLNWGYGLPFPEIASVDDAMLAPAVIGAFAREHPVMVGVRSPEEVQAAVAAPGLPEVPDLEARLSSLREAFASDATWESLLRDGSAEAQAAARRRQRDAF